ncbi:hypothetical protein [Bacillus thuringiensis]|uniref:hypothetical protein n=1 Tax=Bacillus thuringiensis TaxID=1428 RepID=UPI0020C4BF3E|nr:hypothetical protein [Bacillus thuringiensis]MED2764238.1 hypothetical protein [Bacillus thuringiensis]HEQ3524008.1 hypothetical protein [Bacillus cereus]
MLIVVMALFVTALAAYGNNRNPEEVATAYFEDGNSLLSNLMIVGWLLKLFKNWVMF